MSDALSGILDSVRMRGSIFSRATLAAPWGVESGNTTRGVFHAVVDGGAWARLKSDAAPVRLGPGDMVLMPFGDNHLMTDAPASSTAPIGLLTTIDERGMGHLVVDGGGDSTSLICGTLEFDIVESNPLLGLLPPIITVRDTDGRGARLMQSLVDLIADEVDRPAPGSESVVARLTEVLIVYALRNHIEGLSAGDGGWLNGLKEPTIARSLDLIHSSPHLAWTTAELASSVGSSRSAFHARFRSTVGETPADYVMRWRMREAARILKEERLSVGATARRVGYRTEAAFSNAFLRTTGVRPGAYKKGAVA